MSRLSQREKDEIVAAYNAGESPTAIGRKYGISKAYVIKLARYPYRKKERPPKPKKMMRMPVKKDRGKAADPHATGSGRRNASGYLRLM